MHAHGCTWRYDLNAKKSGVLVYCETPFAHKRNACDQIFKLGQSKVAERIEYEHVGIRAHIFQDNACGIEECSTKAKRSLNAVFGLGIRRNGLNMQTCSIISWSIVIPIALYGCELMRLNDTSYKLLEDFQHSAAWTARSEVLFKTPKHI